MARNFNILFALLLVSLLLVGSVSAQDDVEEILESPVVDRSGGWRLPFDGTRYITDGPGEGMHMNKSAEAIDYSQPGDFSWQVLSPANGNVFDVFIETSNDNNSGFGNAVRVNHNGIYSFFAHLELPINKQPGDLIKQGKAIGMTGNSGFGEGHHLHFEARTSVTENNENTGNASPVRSLPGNWWNTWYSPHPDFQHDPGQTSGGAQYQESLSRPSTTFTGARHLSNQVSPPAAPAGWSSNISSNAITLHFGAAPHTPGASSTTYATFGVYTLVNGSSNWIAPTGGASTNSPSRTLNINANTAYLPGGQHVYRANATSTQYSSCNSNPCFRFWEIEPGNAGGGPDVSANFRIDTDNTTLDFCVQGANKYKVWETRNGGVQELVFAGTGCNIMIHRQLGGGSSYSVAARFPTFGWRYSDWVIIHW